MTSNDKGAFWKIERKQSLEKRSHNLNSHNIVSKSSIERILKVNQKKSFLVSKYPEKIQEKEKVYLNQFKLTQRELG